MSGDDDERVYRQLAVVVDTWGIRCLKCPEERTIGVIIEVADDADPERFYPLCAEHVADFFSRTILERPFVVDDEP